MNKKLSGFDKSAPSSLPLTREQSPVSAWDIDTSPFHRLVENQINSTQQLVDIFLAKIEEMLGALKEDKVSKDKKQYALQEKILHNQKNQVRENTEIRKSIFDISEQIIEVEQVLKEILDKNGHSLQNIQKNTAELIRPITAQENLLREGFAPTQLAAPLERLVSVEENSLQHLRSLLGIRQTIEQHHQALQLIGQKLASIEDLLIPVGAISQSKFPDKNFFQKQFENLIAAQDKMFCKVIFQEQRIANAVENFESIAQKMQELHQGSHDLLKQQQQLIEKEKKQSAKESIIFWVFTAIVVALFIILFISGAKN